MKKTLLCAVTVFMAVLLLSAAPPQGVNVR